MWSNYWWQHYPYCRWGDYSSELIFLLFSVLREITFLRKWIGETRFYFYFFIKVFVIFLVVMTRCHPGTRTDLRPLLQQARQKDPALFVDLEPWHVFFFSCSSKISTAILVFLRRWWRKEGARVILDFFLPLWYSLDFTLWSRFPSWNSASLRWQTLETDVRDGDFFTFRSVPCWRRPKVPFFLFFLCTRTCGRLLHLLSFFLFEMLNWTQSPFLVCMCLACVYVCIIVIDAKGDMVANLKAVKSEGILPCVPCVGVTLRGNWSTRNSQESSRQNKI